MLNFLKKTPPIAAMEWSEGELRLSLPAKGGRMTATFPLTAPPEEQGFEVRRRLQELAQRGHLRAPLCVVIPSYACTYKLLKVSAVNGETEGAWKAEALSQLGLPPEEVELAAAEQPDGLFVVACRKGFLHASLTPLLQAGLTVRWVLPSILGLWAFASEKMAESWALIELRGNREGLTAATIAIGKGEGLRLALPFSLNGLKDAERVLTEEIQRAFALYHRLFGEPVQRLLVVGDGQRWQLSLTSLFQAVDATGDELPLPTEGTTVAERMLSAVAEGVQRLLLRKGHSLALPSFPPPQPEAALQWRRLEERLIGATAALTLVGLATAIWLTSKVHHWQTLVTQKQAEVVRLQQTLTQTTKGDYAVKVQGMEQLWRQVHDARNDPLEVLYALSKTFPASAWVTEWVFLRDGQVVVRGSALSHGAVADVARALAQATVGDGQPLFTEVQTNFANARTEGEKTLVDFQVTGWLRERTPNLRRQVRRP
jgi:Tfp pilus assembly protein PilN